MLTAPSLIYSLLSTDANRASGAVIGVLVEAFVGRAHRAAIQLTLSLGACYPWHLFNFGEFVIKFSTTAAVGSVVIDKAGIFLQGTILILVDSCAFTSC
jgi:NADH-quinone oxidoreductase subunit N